jgi:hypothetical protein
MELFGVVEIEAVGKELLALALIKAAIVVLVVLGIDLRQILLSVVTTTVHLLVQAVLVLVEHIG